MRFYLEPVKPIIGSERTVIRFLFVPHKFNNEWRWLEFSLLRQRYVKNQKKPPDSSEVIDVAEWETMGWGD